jgi:PAS domain-containing protein
MEVSLPSNLAANVSPSEASPAPYGAREAALTRVLRVAASAFDAPFAQLVPFGPGATLSHGVLGDSVPDLRALGGRMPPAAALVVVEDAARDARFDGVLPEGARFFAWAVLPSDAGEEGLGPAALAVLDVRPHPATPGERLLDIAAVAGDLLRTADAAGSAEARWVEAEARFQALGDLVSDAVVIADSDGAVLDANDRAAALLGCHDPDELVGRPLDELAPGGDGATVQTVERAVPFEGKELRLAVLRSAEE